MKFNFLDVCRQLISIDSSPKSGTSEIMIYVAGLCERLGFFVDLQEENQNGLKQANVIVRLSENLVKEEFILQSHLDTIDPGNYGVWRETGSNPFNGTIIQNHIYGLGAVDAKLDFVCKLQALLKLKEEGHREYCLAPVLVGTYGHELGMLGVSKLLRKRKVSPIKVLVGDPSDLSLCCASKGIAAVEIRVPFSEEEISYRRDHDVLESMSSQSKIFSGKAAHSSNPEKGENAIDKMFFYLEKMPEGLVVMEMEGGVNSQTIAASAILEVDIVGDFKENVVSKLLKIYRVIREVEKHFQNFPDNRFEPNTATLNFGTIRTYEDHILLRGVCRVTPSVENDIYQKWMKDIGLICEEVGGTFRIRDYKRPFSADQSSSFVRGCLQEMEDLGLESKVSFRASCSEASIFHKMGIECLSFGPGVEEGNAHSSSEHVSLEDLDKATKFYQQVLKRFCL